MRYKLQTSCFFVNEILKRDDEKVNDEKKKSVK